MLSHSTIIRFDKRFTSKFFEKSNTYDVTNKSWSVEFSLLKRNSLRTLLRHHLVDIPANKIYITNLLDCFADFFGFKKFQNPTEIPFDLQDEYEKIKTSILIILKQEFTLEYLLYYIIQKKLGYSQKINAATAVELPNVLNDIHNMLDTFGVDTEFVRPSVLNIKDCCFEQFSNLLISLMQRLAHNNLITLKDITLKSLNDNTIAYVIPECNTLTLIYVMQGAKRKSLITFLREGNKAHCEKLFHNATMLSELLTSIPVSEQEKVWLNSFRTEKLNNIFQTPVDFKTITKLLPENIRTNLVNQYHQKNYLKLDGSFVPAFFTAVTPEDSHVEELLTRVRRSVFVQIMKLVNQENNFNDNRSGYGLINVILNYYADNLGIIKTIESDNTFNDELLIEKAALAFKHKVETIFNLQYFLNFLYTNKLKSSLEKLIHEINENNYDEKLKEIEDFFNFYGIDNKFSANLFFDEDAACDGDIIALDETQIELRAYLTLVNRFDNHGFINRDFQQKLILDRDDLCCIYPGNGVQIAYIEDRQTGIHFPLIAYLLKHGNDVVRQILLERPCLISALSYFSEDRLDAFCQQNFEVLHLLINDVNVFCNILPKLSPEQVKVVLTNLHVEHLVKFIQDISHFNLFLALIPDDLRDLITAKLPIELLQNVLITQDDFIFYIAWLTPNSLLHFISAIDCDYLQNLFQGKESLKILISSLPEFAITPLFEKFGNAYLKIYLFSLNDLYNFVREIPPPAVEHFFSVLCDDVLLEYFASHDSLGLASYVQTDRLGFISKLINLACGSYKDLFVNMNTLQIVLGQVGIDETNLIESLEINYSPSVIHGNQLVTILKNFNSYTARLRFCQLFDENRFSTIVTKFSDLQRILELLDTNSILDFFKSYDSEFFAKLILTARNLETLLSITPVEARQTLYNFIEWQPWFLTLVPDRKTYLNYKNALSIDNQTIFSAYEARVDKFEADLIAAKTAEINALTYRVVELYCVYNTFNHNNYVFAARELSRHTNELNQQMASITVSPFETMLRTYSHIFITMICHLETTYEKYLAKSCNGFFSNFTPSAFIKKVNDDPKNCHFLRLLGLLLNDVYHEVPSLPVSNGNYCRKVLKKLVSKIEKPESYYNLTDIGKHANKRVDQKEVLREEKRIRRLVGV